MDDRLLRDRWLAKVGADASAVLLLLALAADRRGVSFYSRTRMAVELDMDVPRVDRALAHLLDEGLVAHRPWRPGARDGVWQILPLATEQSARASCALSVADILARLGLAHRR